MLRPTPVLLGILVMALNIPGLACTRSPASADVPPPAGVDAAGTQPATQPANLQPDGSATAVFAGGCFWCTEAVFELLDGVSTVVSGYAGGAADTATYQLVSSGSTQHAEVIQITYDPAVISYGKLLQVFFATAHDPTQLNRQGNDVGPQYRSAVFYQSDDEKAFVEAYIQQLTDAKVFNKPIVTTLEPLGKFHPAEEYHQDYARRNPGAMYIVHVSDPKVYKTKQVFKEDLKD
ncbi:MAG: peptide-methionine (S)-S-oxide reductase MsrA [Planctomycetota bacterium]